MQTALGKIQQFPVRHREHGEVWLLHSVQLAEQKYLVGAGVESVVALHGPDPHIELSELFAQEGSALVLADLQQRASL